LFLKAGLKTGLKASHNAFTIVMPGEGRASTPFSLLHRKAWMAGHRALHAFARRPAM